MNMRPVFSMMTAVLMASLLVTTGCHLLLQATDGTGGGSDLEIRSQQPAASATGYPTMEPTSPEEVEVYLLDEEEQQVPDGVIYQPGMSSFGTAVSLEEDYPTAEDPHQQVGFLRSSRIGDADEDEIVEAFRQRVADKGGNVAVMTIDRDTNNAWAHALHLSDADPPTSDWAPAAEALEQFEQQLWSDMESDRDYDRVVVEETRSLNDVQPLVFEGQRGNCYMLTFALEEGSSLHGATRQNFRMNQTLEDGEEQRGIINMEPQSEQGNISRDAHTGHASLRCPETSGEQSVNLFAGVGDDLSTDLGDGEMKMRVHAAEIGEEQLEAMLQQRQEAFEEAAQETDDRNHQICWECASELWVCPDDRPEDCSGFRRCVSRNHGDINVCADLY